MKRKRVTKTALALSIILIIVWSLFGTASTIAWFSDSDTVINTFVIGDLSVELYHKTDKGYELVTGTTKLFDDEALYEPGYTQLVYLKVKNVGTVPFDYKLSVIPGNIVIGKNVFGQDINLTDHLKFGLVLADTEDEILAATKDRVEARKHADTALSDYAATRTDLAVDEEQYAALIVCMPENVGNEANFRAKAARIDLGVNVKATQIEARGKLDP